MASSTAVASTPAPSTEAPKVWEPPTSDTEFVFESVDKAPSWVDKSWAGYDRGPALAVPQGDLYDNDKPYTTTIARPGDTVKFMVNKGSMPARIEVIPGALDPAKGGITKGVPQQSAAPLEDLLKGGYITPDDISDADKAKIAERGPLLKRLVEEGKGAPKAQKISDQFKL